MVHNTAGKAAAARPAAPTHGKKLGSLLRVVSDDEDDDPTSSTTPTLSTEQLIEQEFHQYLNSKDIVPAGMTLVAWWGVRPFFRFFLSVECSSLSSAAKLGTVSCVGVARSGLFGYTGLICLE